MMYGAMRAHKMSVRKSGGANLQLGSRAAAAIVVDASGQLCAESQQDLLALAALTCSNPEEEYHRVSTMLRDIVQPSG